MTTCRRSAKAGALLAGVGFAALWAATGASAHVTVAAPGVTAGASDAAITFRVPDESATASTVGLKVRLPLDHPIAGVLVAPQPGWTAAITQTKLATPINTDDGEITDVVSEIDWRVDSTVGIKPGYFDQFSIIGGKLPDDVTTLVFKAIQTYSDGTQVAWIEQAAPGSATEPEHPAPTLELAAASATDSASPTAAARSVTASAAARQTNPASKGAATTGIVLGIIGIVLGAAALGLVLARDRRSAVRG